MTPFGSWKSRESDTTPGFLSPAFQLKAAGLTLHLLLQTKPSYLAVDFPDATEQASNGCGHCDFTLYTTPNQREEYLLLKLFKTASGGRNQRCPGQNSLRQLPGTSGEKIIEDKALIINTNPVEVYKAWGEPTGTRLERPDQKLFVTSLLSRPGSPVKGSRGQRLPVQGSWGAKQLWERSSPAQGSPSTGQPRGGGEELEHTKDMESRAVADSRALEEGKQSQAVIEDASLPLEQKKRKIQRNLRTLEQTGHVSSKNKYQDILNEIAKDIRNQRLHRKLRKAELSKLQQTLHALNKKAAFYEDQINYYDTYIKTCVDNLKRKNSRRSIKLDGKAEPKGTKRVKPVRYTAAKLHDKGVLLGIDDLQTNQFKNVMFDIIATEDMGIFDVRSKFLGVEMEKVQLNIQDLLQMQYEGVAVMKMFDKVKVNVNLLIYLLNKKFYGK
ncbi:ras GTPase-activating-like protein IQGAP2 [Rattus rattus]|uniref:ras GTPase-activating-like protein IQGAP2 n=1 Tax=Rattus rattus TaxID=10117 RepID=UPI0013F36F79|nr:ras GTPase-activating-like protein IQGAP2 [Rattus rattus]